MPVSSIPGYYYDPVKNKYFKILPNHVAPAGSKYSQQSVKKEAEDQIVRKRQKLHDQKTLQTRIDRARLRHNLLGGGAGLGRESGDDIDGRSAGIGAWAQGLERRTIYRDPPDVTKRFAYDDATGSFVVGYNIPASSTWSLRYAIPTTASHKRCWHPYMPNLGVTLDSEIGSISISPSRMLLTTAIGGSRPTSASITALPSPDAIDAHATWVSEDCAEAYQTTPMHVDALNTSSIHLRSTHPLTTYWTSAASPLMTQSEFAIGASNDTKLLRPDETDWCFAKAMTFRHPNAVSHGTEAEEVLAVDWLSENTILNGCRSSHIHLWDVRFGGSASTSNPIKHASSIAHVRRQNEYKVVVAGIQNQLCTYDLRFLSHLADATTRPYLSYPTYRNQDLNGLAVGFDIKRDLVAAGTDDERVQIFDGMTGKELQTGATGELSRKHLEGPARCVRFVDHMDREEVRVCIAAGGNIEEWAW